MARRRHPLDPGLTRLGWALLILSAVALGALTGAGLAHADEGRYAPAARGTRPEVERWRELVAVYDDWDVDLALRVIDCESEGGPGVWNRAGSRAHGLFQLLGWEAKAYELYGVWDVSDPAVNVGVAHWIWRASGGRFGTTMGWAASAGCWS